MESTVEFFADGRVKFVFKKTEAGVWQYNAKKQILNMKIPNESFQWGIAKIERDRIEYKNKKGAKETGYLQKQ